MAKRLAWNADFLRYLTELQEKKPIIWGGDWNVVTSKADLQWPSKNWEVQPGARDQEREGHERLLKEVGLVDVWRHLHPNEKEFSYAFAPAVTRGEVDWLTVIASLRRHSSARYGGWRIDGFIVSKSLLPQFTSAAIHHSVSHKFPNASDHWPSVADFTGSL